MTQITHPTKISILHISDLHFGMKGARTLWPTLKTLFHEDIRRIHRKSGPWEAVIFSGDLTQTGSSQEFSDLTRELVELWETFASLGFKPEFIVVPGNHDLVRPEALDSVPLTLKNWGNNEKLRELFWSTTENDYRKHVESCFSNFSKWLDSLNGLGVPVVGLRGALPGDCSQVVNAGGTRLGVIGLNSAWLQLDDSNYKGQLDLSISQLLTLTNNSPDAWVSKNTFNLVVTHHPTSWLTPRGQLDWTSEISPTGRFDAHLFGHMHEPIAERISVNGSRDRISIQAPSIFGLERIGTAGPERRHGFSLLQFIQDPRSFRIWPRQAHRMPDGAWRFIGSPDFHLDEDQDYMTVPLAERSGNGSKPIAATALMPSLDIAASASAVSGLKSAAAVHPSHAAIRSAERTALLKSFGTNSAAWVVSDWGLGTKEFLISALVDGTDRRPLYTIDVSQYKNLDQLLTGTRDQLGYSFESLIQRLNQEGRCLLHLQDAVIGENDRSFESDLEHLVETSKSVAPNIYIVISCRISPAASSLPIIRLSVLNELETALYVRSHPSAGEKYGLPDSISALHRHTDGIPVRLDTALQFIDVVGLKELSSTNSDVIGKNPGIYDSSPALSATIEDLKRDPYGQRTFELLKALAMFPAGERFNSIRRFNGADGFYPQNAQRLIDAALIDKVESSSIQDMHSEHDARALVVRRPVREHLYSELDHGELKRLNDKAISHYFGVEWRSARFKTPSSLRFDRPDQAAWVLTNASFMVMRVLNDLRNSVTAEGFREALALATSFCASLISGDHFRTAYVFLEEAMPVITECLEQLPEKQNLVLIKRQWAQVARMSKKTEQSLSISLENIVHASSSHRSSIQLNIALCYQGLQNYKDAVIAAKKCIEIDPDGNIGLQAKSIVAACDEDKESSERKLLSIEKAARRSSAITVANNIALSRAEQHDDPVEAGRIAKPVFESSVNTDHYNTYRAAILIARGELELGRIVDKSLLSVLIKAYHYLYSQRLGGLFNDCHEVLWKTFHRLNQEDNILRLFMHSSFIWRLRRQVSLEHKYLSDLGKKYSALAAGGRSVPAGIEMGYLLNRLSDTARLPGAGISPAVAPKI
jgi:tetratricopeptide (TPR) repeat protein/predicted phosphodiesterase